MKTLVEILREIQWQLDEIDFLDKLYERKIASLLGYSRGRSACVSRIVALLWVLGDIGVLYVPDLEEAEIIERALALLDNANITPSC